MVFLLTSSGCDQKATNEEIDLVSSAMINQSYQNAKLSFHETVTIDAYMSSRSINPAEFSISTEMDQNASYGSFRIHDIRIDNEENIVELFVQMSGQKIAGDIEELYKLLTVSESLQVIFQKGTFYVQASGKWYKMDMREFVGMSAQDMSDSEREKLNCVMEKSIDDPMSFLGASQYDLSAINFYKDFKKLTPEEIDGIEVDHYSFSYDYEKLIEELPDLMQTSMEPMMDIYDECGMPEMRKALKKSNQDLRSNGGDQIKDMYKQIFENANVEIWLDKEGNIRRIIYTMHLDLDEFATAMGDSRADYDGAILDVTMTESYSDFNKTFVFEQPEKTLPINILIEELFGSQPFAPTTNVTSPNASRVPSPNVTF